MLQLLNGIVVGVALAAVVVDLHGGRITLESELGEGSTFPVYPPAAEDAGG